MQSVLSPAGTQASSIHGLWLLMLALTTVVFVAVVVGVCLAVVRGIRNRSPEQRLASSDAALSWGVGSAVAATVVILLVLLIASVRTGRAIASLRASSAVTIEITGHQWWWEIAYEDATPSRRVVTANEIHIPTGRPVVLTVTSRDVIHSFWVPNLQGKRDLIPGYTTAVWLRADRRGIFRGQCAEFCGLQHAHMASTWSRSLTRTSKAGSRRCGNRRAHRLMRRSEEAMTSSCGPGARRATRSGALRLPVRSHPT